MQNPKKIIPSLALLIMMLLGENSIAAKTVNTQISELSYSKNEAQINLNFKNTNNQIELISNIAVDLKNSGHNQESLKIFDRAVQIAQKISSIKGKILALSDIAAKLGQAGQKKQSLEIFDQVSKLANKTSEDFSEYDKEEVLGDITIKKAQGGFINNALESGKKLPSNLLKAQVFNEISLVLIERGQRKEANIVLQQALEYVKKITDKDNYYYESNGSCANYKHEVLSKIATNLSLQAQLDKALQVAKGIRGCFSANGESTQDYQAWAFLGILNNLRKSEAVKETWNAAQKIQASHEKATIWSAIAVKMADLGDTEFALLIGKKLGVEIPPITEANSGSSVGEFFTRENRLADIGIKLAQKQQFDGAMEIAQTMTANDSKLSGFLRDYFPSPSPKTIVLIEIAKNQAVAGKVSQALELANTIPDSTYKTVAQIAIAHQLQKSRQQTQAKQILQNLSLPKPPAKPDEFNAYESHRQIAIALVKAKQLEMAVKLINSIEKKSEKESIFNDIANELANLGQIQQALNLAKNIESPGYKTSLNNKVAIKLLETGKLEQVLEIINSDKEVDTEILSKLAEKFAKVGEKEQAIKVVETINTEDLKVKTLATIALIFTSKK
jgi:tetratricopeptide (TPR) repeat protein